MTRTDLKTPDWALEVWIDGSAIQTTVKDDAGLLPNGQVPAGAEFDVSGTPSAQCFIYVIVVATGHQLSVLYPASGTDTLSPSGVAKRLPLTRRFTAPFTGWVHVVESPVAVRPEEWLSIIDGRDPPLKGTDPTNSRWPGGPAAARAKSGAAKHVAVAAEAVRVEVLTTRTTTTNIKTEE